jgi:hypothetical protein
MTIISGLDAENALSASSAECRPSLQDFAGCDTPVSGDMTYAGLFCGERE